MDRGAWWAAVHGVDKSQIRLSDFTFTFHFHALEKEMATHSSVLAWRVPGTGEPGGLLSTGSHRVGHDWSDLAAAVEGKRHSRNVMGSQCLPHPPRTLSPKTIQPGTQASPVSRDMIPAKVIMGWGEIESAYVSIFIVYLVIWIWVYRWITSQWVFLVLFVFFLIHSHLILSHIDVYMLYFRKWSCTDYGRKWSITPGVAQ